MPVPFYDKIVKAWVGTRGLIDAVNVETTGNRNAQTDINNLGFSVLNWKFSASIDESDPGSTFLAFNNAVKASATVVTFNVNSNIVGARFDQLFTELNPRTRIYIQDRNTPANNILFRVTATASVTATEVDVQVAVEQSNGDEFAADAVLNVHFFTGILATTQLTTLTQLTNLSGTGDIRISNGVFQVVDDGGTPTPPGTHINETLEYGKNTSAALPVSPLTAQDTAVEGQWLVEFPALVVGEFWVFRLPVGRTLTSIINPSLPGVDQQISWTQDGGDPRLWHIGPAVRTSAATTLQITTSGA